MARDQGMDTAAQWPAPGAEFARRAWQRGAKRDSCTRGAYKGETEDGDRGIKSLGDASG